MPRVLEGSRGSGRFLMGEVLLYGARQEQLLEKSAAQKQRAITRMAVGFAVAVAVLRVVLSDGNGPQGSVGTSPSSSVRVGAPTRGRMSILYMCTSPVKKRTPLGPCSSPMHRALSWS